MGDLTAIWQGLDWSFLTRALFSVAPILICLTVHELAHGATALALGDDTAKRMGRLTLNPIKHVDPVGLIMLVVARFGWAKPVPVNMSNFRRPKTDMAITALAGPLSNFLFAALIFLFQVPLFDLFLVGGIGYYIADGLFITAVISIYLGIFNLLPIPPLDGSKILFAVLPDAQHDWLMRYERFGFLILFALIWFGFLNEGPLSEFMDAVVRWFLHTMNGPSMFLFY